MGRLGSAVRVKPADQRLSWLAVNRPCKQWRLCADQEPRGGKNSLDKTWTPAQKKSNNKKALRQHMISVLLTFALLFFQLCCSCYSWAFQSICQWRKCLSRAARYGQVKHFLRPHNSISLRSLQFPHIPARMFFQCSVFWPKSDDPIDSTFPPRGSRLCLCNIVLLFHSKTQTGESSNSR